MMMPGDFLKYSFIKTSDKPQMNTTATTVGISDAGAAPVGYQLQRLPIGCQPTSTLLWCTMSKLKLVPTYTAWWTEARACKQLSQGCYVVAHRPGGRTRDLPITNPAPYH